ncbi:MAG TPA: uracil-DNA glycosylase family protein [Noviherbaspirillum sp.]|uniref:uracil-DNA glycosylase family protein n=1 Tax=Noviherbaspirillum sp. TaxID=1926288 RepID=UPI002B46DACC|nr:uracil-DNA glycosylase family protein [Noviherbaspirillum sp.]HJV88241.1 uracil-DNA glycosylase family protein [Noviherbaspirillum sp.]
MSLSIPESILDTLALADQSWRPILLKGLEAIAEADPGYLAELAADNYLPTGGRLFAAFTLPLDAVRYVLVGEGPYPRERSATGVCFMDGAVESLWSEKGLSKEVNRATSLRNFMKMLLVADGLLTSENTSGDAIAHISLRARAIGSPFIQTLTELQANLTRHGFLLLNATLVYRPDVPPLKDAKAWRPFLRTVLEALDEHAVAKVGAPPALVLWGKIAEQLNALEVMSRFPRAVSEHPYNLSFIGNKGMQDLFGPMHLLQQQVR